MGARVCVRLTGNQAVTGFALPVQQHSKVEVGHEIFSTVIPIPSYSKKCSCRYWQNLTLRHLVDLTIKQLVDMSTGPLVEPLKPLETFNLVAIL